MALVEYLARQCMPSNFLLNLEIRDGFQVVFRCENLLTADCVR